MNLGVLRMNLVVPDNAKVLDLRELIQGETRNLSPSTKTVQRSVLNPLSDVFGGPGGSNCVVPPQGGNEENKSFVATSFLKNKTRTVLLSSVQCFLRDKYGLLHEVGGFGRRESVKFHYERLCR
ncbi:hypothetical protein TNCV_4324381 [Trichonephila clavipes]|nr:hypothetical protein TNCV_4324381 [Trichonephila clavipes]